MRRAMRRRGPGRAALRWGAAVVALLAAARPAGGCLPASAAPSREQECFFGSAAAAANALETAAAATGCTADAATGRCTCPETVPPVSVCTNWAVNLVRYYYPHHGAAAAGPDGVEFNDFAGNLSRSLAGVCDTYGGQLLEQRPPDGIPADTMAAACDRIQPPPAASTAGVTLAVAVGTTLFAVVVLDSIVDTPGRDSAPAPVPPPLQIQESTLWNGVVY